MLKRIGVLALQGNYQAHHQRLVELGAQPLLVKKISELDAVAALVLPGGESTTMLKLMDDEFFHRLGKSIENGLPVLATCAGVILLANGVTNPAQKSLKVLDVDVERNSYGRQIDSFIAARTPWTSAGMKWVGPVVDEFPEEAGGVETVFIRAPRIARVGSQVETLISQPHPQTDPNSSEPLLVRQNNILAATFHPEHSSHARSIHRGFLNSVPK